MWKVKVRRGPKMCKESCKAQEDNMDAGGVDLHQPAVVEGAGQPGDVQVQDRVVQDTTTAEDIGSLPDDGQVGEQDVDDEVLGVGVGEVSLVGAEHHEEYVTNEETQKHKNCKKQVAHVFKNCDIGHFQLFSYSAMLLSAQWCLFTEAVL